MSSIRSAIAWTTALLVLAGALWYFNQPDVAADDALPEATATAAPETVYQAADIPEGKEVGQRCPAFTAPLYGAGGAFTLADQLGKVTVINFWATWCTPCVAELPHFQQLQDAYPDQVQVIALHSHLVTDDVQAYLDKQGYTLPFALDGDGSIIQSLGGSTMLPMTVIVDQSGVITYNAVGSVTYEKLESLVLPLLNQ